MNGIKEIPMVENERIGIFFAEDRVPRHQFNNRLGINVANGTPLEENVYDEISDIPEYIECINTSPLETNP